MLDKNRPPDGWETLLNELREQFLAQKKFSNAAKKAKWTTCAKKSNGDNQRAPKRPHCWAKRVGNRRDVSGQDRGDLPAAFEKLMFVIHQ